jgi:hypothetical protein
VNKKLEVMWKKEVVANIESLEQSQPMPAGTEERYG